MNNDASILTRSELLALDELGDELEASVRSDADFDIEEFLASVSNPAIAKILRSEYECLSGLAGQDTAFDRREFSNRCASIVDAFRAGQQIDDFELIEKVGQGATAVVWKAKSRKLDRDVALKFPTIYSDSMLHRLERESRAVAKLQHPNIATIYEIRSHADLPYLVSEFVDGESLKQAMDEGQISIPETVDILIATAEAVAYSHSFKVIHRDLKPQNILLKKLQQPVVVDFGLARILQDELAVITQEGDFIGTPAYMAPEQAKGGAEVDQRTDIFALGVMMYQMMSGKLPFTGSVQATVHKIVNESPLPPSAIAKVPPDLNTICLKCIEKSPESRFQSAQELALELRRYKNGEPIHSRPVSSLEKIVRWSKRKPAEAFLAVSLLTSLLVIAIGSSIYGYSMKVMRDNEVQLRIKAENSEADAKLLARRVETALQETRKQKSIATAEAFENRSSVNFLKSVFQDKNPVMWVLKGDGVGAGSPPTLRQLFENAANRLENEYEGNELTRANLLETLADSSRSAGYLDLSRRLLQKATDYRRDQIEITGGIDTSAESSLLYNQFLLAKLEHDCGNYSNAAQSYKGCISQIENFPSPPRSVLEVKAEAAFHLGRLLLMLQDNREAESYFELSKATFVELGLDGSFLAKASEIGVEFCNLRPGEVPETGPIADFFQEDSWAQRLVEQFSNMLVLRARKKWDSVGVAYRQVLETLRERLPEDNRWYLLALGDYAGTQLKAGFYEEAYRAGKEAVRIGESLAPDHPRLLDAKFTIGKELCRGGDPQAAIRYLVDFYDHYESKKDFTNRADVLFLLIESHLALEDQISARRYCELLMPLIPESPNYLICWARFLESRAFEGHDPLRSKQAFEGSLEAINWDAEPLKNGIWCSRMATVLCANGRLKRALEFAQVGIESDAEHFFEEHPRVANRRMQMGDILLVDSQVSEAKAQYEKAVAIRKKYLGSHHRLTIEAQRAVDSVRSSSSN